MKTRGARLCLNMIVRNEAANIERCLRSLVEHVACWVIADTGSSDGTQDLIRRFFAERRLPGEMHEFPFVTFDQARNRALDLARTSALTFDYILFADADMELTVSDKGFARSLSADAYMVRQDSGIAYWNTRLLKRGAPARYVGVTHEYLDLGAGTTDHLEGVAYIDHASGANRPGKFARDAALLCRALEAEADPGLRARYVFYLANSLRDDGDPAGALARYEERAGMSGWREEVFVSLLNAAQIRAQLGHAAEEVIAAFEAARDACPARGVEALHGAARFCREHALHERGYNLAVQGRDMPVPEAGLFVAEWIYRYGLLDEIAVNAYWSDLFAECVAACDRMLAEPSLPRGDRGRALRNRQFALDKIAERRRSAHAGHERSAELLRIARQRETAGAPIEEVVSAYLAAAEAGPERVEALHGAARFCRYKSLHDRGYDLAMRGLAALESGDRGPPEERWIYDHGLRDELAVHAYWTGRYQVCLECCETLLRGGDLPDGMRERVEGNARFAMAKLSEAGADLTHRAARAPAGTDVPADEVAQGRSFDLFDTLVARRCVHPREIFAAMEKISGVVDFAKSRVDAEAEIFAARYTLDDIYHRLVSHHGLPIAELERLKRLELDLEYANLFPIREHCLEVGPQDVIVSDMYMPESWIAKVVSGVCGLAPRAIHVSSHGKRRGEVWGRIARTMRVTEHVGDNPLTDRMSPERAGIPSRLTTVATRTDVEEDLAAFGFAPLSNLVREARLTAWTADEALRRVQAAQIQLNFPLLFLTTLHVWRLADEKAWTHVLMSARDCYLWHGLYQGMRQIRPSAPSASYFMTSRVTRAHPSPGYLSYVASQCRPAGNVVVDLAGTGWSLSRLRERLTTPVPDVFLFHQLDMPSVLRDYETFGGLTGPLSIYSAVRRSMEGYDSEVLERMNFAPHPSVIDIRSENDGHRPIFAEQTYSDRLASIISSHHAAFESARGLLRHLTFEDIWKMMGRDTKPAIDRVYARFNGMLSPLLDDFGPYKVEEEAAAVGRLQVSGKRREHHTV